MLNIPGVIGVLRTVPLWDIILRYRLSDQYGASSVHARNH